MNENRSVFALDGVTGMLIATVLLLSILAVLTVWGLSVQQSSAANYYDIKNETAIGSGIGFGEGHTTSKASDHIVDVKVGE
jgi:high-affinity Fe2+/Pb2+ permease